MNHATQPWDLKGYGDIVAAVPHGDALTVEFANGDVVMIEGAALGLRGPYEVRTGDPTTALIAETPDGTREIDWMVIRAASDPNFARELRERDAEEARRIGRRVRALRENLGLSQRAAATLAGMPAPQLARLERGETDMRLSTLGALLRALGASFQDIAGPNAPEVSAKELRKRAQAAGAPRVVLDRIVEAVGYRELLQALARGFRWPPAALEAGVPTAPELGAPVRLKSRIQSAVSSSALLALARTVSELSARAFSEPRQTVPRDAAVLREAVLAESVEMSLDGLLRWTWSAGVVVVPMEGPGGFSAAAWLVDQRPVIVLKEAPNFAAYWLFALGHELGHLAHGHVGIEGVVDVDTPFDPDQSDSEEDAANRFALDLLVPQHEELLAAIRREAAGPRAHLLFKPVVESVAADTGVNTALLALIAAHDMPDVARPRDRWGSAMNLARLEGSGRAIVQAHFARNVDLERLTALDASLVRAVTLAS